jgi:hypothetical protein
MVHPHPSTHGVLNLVKFWVTNDGRYHGAKCIRDGGNSECLGGALPSRLKGCYLNLHKTFRYLPWCVVPEMVRSASRPPPFYQVMRRPPMGGLQAIGAVSAAPSVVHGSILPILNGIAMMGSGNKLQCDQDCNFECELHC